MSARYALDIGSPADALQNTTVNLEIYTSSIIDLQEDRVPNCDGSCSETLVAGQWSQWRKLTKSINWLYFIRVNSDYQKSWCRIINQIIFRMFEFEIDRVRPILTWPCIVNLDRQGLHLLPLSGEQAPCKSVTRQSAQNWDLTHKIWSFEFQNLKSKTNW